MGSSQQAGTIFSKCAYLRQPENCEHYKITPILASNQNQRVKLLMMYFLQSITTFRNCGFYGRITFWKACGNCQNPPNIFCLMLILL